MNSSKSIIAIANLPSGEVLSLKDFGADCDFGHYCLSQHRDHDSGHHCEQWFDRLHCAVDAFASQVQQAHEAHVNLDTVTDRLNNLRSSSFALTNLRERQQRLLERLRYLKEKMDYEAHCCRLPEIQPPTASEHVLSSNALDLADLRQSRFKLCTHNAKIQDLRERLYRLCILIDEAASDSVRISG